jgi:hypothetical protein
MVVGNLCRCPIVWDLLVTVHWEEDMPRHRFVGQEGYLVEEIGLIGEGQVARYCYLHPARRGDLDP